MYRGLGKLECVVVANRIAVLVLLLILSFGRISFAQQTSVEKTIEEFESMVTAEMDARADGCVMVAVFKGNAIIWAKGFGLADVENKVPATAETIGRTGSISKSFTAIVICQLAEKGVLNLDDPVAKYFPDINQLANKPADAKPITFRMLASHTAGIAREPQSVRIAAAGPINLWEQKVLEAIPKTSFKTKPMTEYSYSNIGFGMLGLAGSRAAEEPFMSMVEKQIFVPLEMKSSTFVVDDDEMKRRLAVGYILDRSTRKLSSEIPTREHAGRGYKVPNGGIYSTVGDMAKFAAAMMDESENEVLTTEFRKQVFSPQAPADRYGLGFKILAQKDGLHVVGHGGSVAGYQADLRFDLKSKWGVATLKTSQYNPPIPKLFIDIVESSRN